MTRTSQKSGYVSGAIKCALITAAALCVAGQAYAGATKYKYDALGRVILASSPNGSQNGYGYDAAGNRTTHRRIRIPAPTVSDRLFVGQGLIPGAQLVSSNGHYVLAMQDDGNLVIYGPNGPIWTSGTFGNPIAHFVLQGDGNMVMYGPTAQPYWSSATLTSNPVLVMQTDGNLVLYNSAGAIWSSGTACNC